MKTIRIASGQGFWGDWPQAPVDQATLGNIDYMMMDYLAEVTMSIMQKQKLKDPNAGYARDFVDVIDRLLPDLSVGKFKIVSNAGGVNPHACKDAIMERAKQKGLSIKVAVVDGDNILDRMDSLIAQGHTLSNMETGEPIFGVKDQLLSANVYFGARPMVEALKAGADVVVTGRVTDTGLCLAPLIHEFGWRFEDYDKMAAGTIAGHILECGAQSTGGNYTDWQSVPDMYRIGFPIVEASADGSFVVTKHEGTGGLVSEMTVKEQLLYEIGDPAEYITPDCVADFTSIQLKQEGENRVRVYSIKGKPATPFYKVSASYAFGFKLTSTLVYCWPDPLLKARAASEILRKRARALELNIEEFRFETVGFNATNEQPGEAAEDLQEVELRVSCFSADKAALDRFGKEIAPLVLTGPSGVTGFAGGRPKASEVVAYWPALLKKEACKAKMQLFKD